MDSEPSYSGTELTLLCSVAVPEEVDEHIDFLTHVDVSYQRNGISISNDTRVTVTDIEKWDSSPGTTVYQSQIKISPLVLSYDVGKWACPATSANPFITLHPKSDFGSFALGDEDTHCKKVLQ